ncbi:MAG: PIN domain-containing protein [Anaerolineae bacterium]|jgi:predicted nucleic acid-binding protein|nr:PIN domain-containing protein [Anaerolineae bacterium]
MRIRSLVDTNVLVYSYDRRAADKYERAFAVLDGLARRRAGALSTQVLGEFFVVVTRKLAVPMSASQAFSTATNLWRSWPVISLTDSVVLEAMRGARDYGMSYYDAQLWAVARLNQIPVIFSEDFQDGQELEGVRFVNPFRPDFQLDDWIPL